MVEHCGSTGPTRATFKTIRTSFSRTLLAAPLLQTEGDLDVPSFAFVDVDFDLASVGTGLDIIDNGADRAITGDGGDNTINAAGGNDTVDGAGGSDTILGGEGVDDIDLGAPGEPDTVSVADFAGDGADRDIVRNFESGAGGDVFNIEAVRWRISGLTLDGSDNFLTTNSVRFDSFGTVTFPDAAEVVLYTGASISGDAAASPNADVLDGTSALAATGGISTANDGDDVLFGIEDTAGNTLLYLIEERESENNEVQAGDEMTLVGVLEDVDISTLTVDNFSNVDLF